MKWSSRPFVRITLFYIAGILAVQYVPFIKSFPFYYGLILLTVFLVTSILISVSKIPWQFRGLSGLSIGLLIFMIAALLTRKHEVEINKPLPEGSSIYFAEVLKEPMMTGKTVKTILKVSPVSDSIESFERTVRSVAYLYQDSLSGSLKYGDLIVFNGVLKSPSGPANPGEFDYRSFLLRNNIVATTYIAANNWQFLQQGQTLDIFSLANKARKYLLNALEENGLSGRNQAVASAVILGYDNLMDTELEQEYVGAGAMHILCVSGLHVGIVYLALNFLLSFLNRNNFQKWLKAVFLLLMVWSYALLTGLSPSVIRASTMLSLFIVGSTISRGRDPYNTLAASAMIMLVYDPMLLFNVGFQLSYSAVIGILAFYKPIYDLFFIKNFVADKIWSIVVVSVSAQLGTFPLAAHYFHFFPTYFWITNILIFPLSFAIIGLGMLFISVSWLPFIPKLVGVLLSFSVYLMNESVGFVNQLPGHGIENLHFPWLKVFVVYGLIFLLFRLIVFEKIKSLMPTIFVILILVVVQTLYKYETLERNQVVVYSVNKHSALDFIQGDRHICLMDSILYVNAFKQDFHLKNAMVNWGLASNNYQINEAVIDDDLGFYYDGEFGKFGEFTFVRIDQHSKYFKTNLDKISLDALIISDRKSVDMQNIQECFDFEVLVLDSSVPYWKSKKIKEWSLDTGIQVFDVVESGAWTVVY